MEVHKFPKERGGKVFQWQTLSYRLFQNHGAQTTTSTKRKAATQLYRFYRNRVNRARKMLQRQYYSKKVNGLSRTDPCKWWKEMKQLLGLKKADNGLQGLTSSVADGNSHRLADMLGAFFQLVTTDYRAISPEDCFSIGADYNMPDNMWYSPARSKNKCAPSRRLKPVALMISKTGSWRSLQSISVVLCVHFLTAVYARVRCRRCGNQPSYALSQRFHLLQRSRSIYGQYHSLPPCQRSWNATWLGG